MLESASQIKVKNMRKTKQSLGDYEPSDQILL